MKNIALFIFLFCSVPAFSQITVNTNFAVNGNLPIDARDTLTTLADTAFVTWTYPGLLSYVVSVDAFWYYTGSFWKELQTGGGTLSPQVNLGSGQTSSIQTAIENINNSYVHLFKDSRYVPLFRIKGQSNANGLGLNSSADPGDLTAKQWAQIWVSGSGFQDLVVGTNNQGNTASQHGIELGLAKYWQEFFPDDTLYIVKFGLNGTLITRNMRGSDGYSTIESRTSEAIDTLLARGKIPLLIDMWSQGSADSGGDTLYAKQYYYKLDSLIALNEEKYGVGIPTIAIAINETCCGSVPGDVIVNNYFRDKAKKDPNFYFLDRQYSTGGDIEHFTAAGFLVQARDLLNLMKKGMGKPVFVNPRDVRDYEASTPISYDIDDIGTSTDTTKFYNYKATHLLSTVAGKKRLSMTGNTAIGTLNLNAHNGLCMLREYNVQQADFTYDLTVRSSTDDNQGGIIFRVDTIGSDLTGFLLRMDFPGNKIDLVRIVNNTSNSVLGVHNMTLSANIDYRVRVNVSQNIYRAYIAIDSIDFGEPIITAYQTSYARGGVGVLSAYFGTGSDSLIYFSDFNVVTGPVEQVDNSSTNELQTLSITGSKIRISKTNTEIDIAGIGDVWAQGTGFAYMNQKALIGGTTNPVNTDRLTVLDGGTGTTGLLIGKTANGSAALGLRGRASGVDATPILIYASGTGNLNMASNTSVFFQTDLTAREINTGTSIISSFKLLSGAASDNVYFKAWRNNSTAYSGLEMRSDTGYAYVRFRIFNGVEYRSQVNNLGHQFFTRLSGTDSKKFEIFGSGAVNIGAGTEAASSIFDVVSTTRGSRPAPSMTTTQRNAIATPATGLQVYNTSLNKLNYYNGSAWRAVVDSTTADARFAILGGNDGAITLGTNNATPFHLETNNTRRLSIPSSGIANTPASTKALVLSSTDSLGYTTLQSADWTNTVTQSGSDTLQNSAIGYGHFTRVGNYVTFTLRIEIALTSSGNANTVYISPPVASTFATAQTDVIGTATLDSQGLSSANTARQRALVFADTVNDKIGVSFDPVASLSYPENRMYISVTGSYPIQ